MLPESPPIVSGVSDMDPSVSKRRRDTESDAVIRLEKLHAFFSNECSIGIPPEIVTVYFS